MATCIAPQSKEPQNYNGPIISKVLGISSPQYCCDSCARVAECVRWVYDPGLKQCNLLSADGFALIGGTFTSGRVSPGYDAPPIPNNWGLSMMVALAILTVVYLLGGMVRPACPVLRSSTSPRLHVCSEREGEGGREGGRETRVRTHARTHARTNADRSACLLRPNSRTGIPSKVLEESTWCRTTGSGQPCRVS